MRINVYGEELTTETELVIKEVEDEKFGKRSFFGLRFYLESPDQLHSDPDDDDRSAITLWIPWTRAEGHNFNKMGLMLDHLMETMYKAQDKFFDEINKESECDDH